MEPESIVLRGQFRTVTKVVLKGREYEVLAELFLERTPRLSQLRKVSWKPLPDDFQTRPCEVFLYNDGCKPEAGNSEDNQRNWGAYCQRLRHLSGWAWKP